MIKFLSLYGTVTVYNGVMLYIHIVKAGQNQIGI
jgi:hypothetical protein